MFWCVFGSLLAVLKRLSLLVVSNCFSLIFAFASAIPRGSEVMILLSQTLLKSSKNANHARSPTLIGHY